MPKRDELLAVRLLGINQDGRHPSVHSLPQLTRDQQRALYYLQKANKALI